MPWAKSRQQRTKLISKGGALRLLAVEEQERFQDVSAVELDDRDTQGPDCGDLSLDCLLRGGKNVVLRMGGGCRRMATTMGLSELATSISEGRGTTFPASSLDKILAGLRVRSTDGDGCCGWRGVGRRESGRRSAYACV
jgi:hypothetical protein